MNLFDSLARTVDKLLLRTPHNFKQRQPSRRRSTARRLRTETLERRQLLAADIGLQHHNVFDAEDVDDNGEVSPLDALLVLNSIRKSSENLNQTAADKVFADVNDDGNRSALDALMVLNRIKRDRDATHQPAPRPVQDTGDRLPNADVEVRSFDGTGNNLTDPVLGSAGQAFLRVAEADYGDGVSTPAGQDRVSTRQISNTLSATDFQDSRSERGLSNFLYVWGQFIDHDIDLTDSQIDGESLAIEVPVGDPMFDPLATGTATIALTRSQFDPETGTSPENPRQQTNAITSYIDGSQVYGSDQSTADSLRTFDGGHLKATDDGLLPTDENGSVMAGDVRAAENPSLTAIQTLFVREHNRLADKIASADPTLTDEEIYQRARAIVIAEIQAITYNEFLPALLGKRGISRYEGYDATVDPTIATEFATAAFRFGHSTLNDEIEFFDNDGRPITDAVALKDAFFKTGLLSDFGIDSILKYDASSQSQEIDLEVVDSLRNFLFGPPGAGGLDLVALNIQRGRDHGLSDYNSTRVAYGLDPVESMADITSDTELQQKLEVLYGDVNDIDLWVGLLAEDHVRGASVGDLTGKIIADQFERLRDGDRFYYENIFSGQDLRSIARTSLADVIQRNTEVKGLQENVFFVLAEVSGKVTAMPAAELSSSRSSRRPGTSQRAEAVSGIGVELLNDAGEVISTAVTNSRGEYRFRSIPETGDYKIRLTDSGEAIDILISNGSTRLRGIDFRIAAQ